MKKKSPSLQEKQSPPKISEKKDVINKDKPSLTGNRKIFQNKKKGPKSKTSS